MNKMDRNMKLQKRKKNEVIKDRKLFRRCGECSNCLVSECGECKHCLDMPKFGGSYKLKKACVKRECLVSRRGREDPVIKEITQQDKLRRINQSLSVQYINGRVVKYRSGEKMHNGKLLIIAHSENKDAFRPKPGPMVWVKPAVEERSPPPTPPPADLDIDEFVEKYLQVYYDDKVTGGGDMDAFSLLPAPLQPTLNPSHSPVNQLNSPVNHPTPPARPVALLPASRHLLQLLPVPPQPPAGLMDTDDILPADQLLPANQLLSQDQLLSEDQLLPEEELLPSDQLLPAIELLPAAALEDPAAEFEDSDELLSKDLLELRAICTLCTLNNKCGNCIVNTALKEIGNLIDI